jgi:esterase
MARLAAYRLGTGPRGTVLLHGFLGSGANLRRLAQRWIQADPTRTLLVPDLRGHGGSPPLPAGATLATLAGDVLETARLEGLGTPLTLLGHSLGGRVALAAAGLLPRAEVCEVVLVDINPGPLHGSRSDRRFVIDALLTVPEEAPTRRALRDHLLAAGLDGTTADWLVMSARMAGGRCRWSFDRQALDDLFERTGEEDVWDIVEGGAAVRCIRASRSDCVSDEDVARLRAAGCPVLTLAAGHDVPTDAPEELLAALVRP